VEGLKFECRVECVICVRDGSSMQRARSVCTCTVHGTCHCARYVSKSQLLCVFMCVCVCVRACVCVCVCEHRPAFSTGANTELLGGDGHECRTNSCDVVNCVCISSH
jgi:hypothetical protein